MRPEYAHSLEFQHLKYWDRGSITSSLYYRYAEEVVERIRILEDEENGITRTLPINLSTEDAYGVELTMAFRPWEWLRLNGDLNVYRSVRQGRYESQLFEADHFSWHGSGVSRVTFAGSTDVQFRFRYRAPTQTVQGDRKAMFTADLGISRDIFNDNGSLTVSVRDVFNTRKRRYTVDTDQLFATGEFQWRSRQITVNLNYRLNQKKGRNRSNNGLGPGGEMEF